MIDATTKRALGQMIRGVQVVATHSGGITRAYTSHWVSQVAFEEPLIMASVSPRHDTHPLMVEAGWWTVSVLAADQIDVGQYFSYPGRRFHHLAHEMLTEVEGYPVVTGCVAWFRAETVSRLAMGDHELFFGRVIATGLGRLKEPPLLYSSRHGWRVTGDKARPPGVSIRDQLLARLDALGLDAGDGDVDDTEG
ncbi:MAG: flavin reductase family protein [Actinomycetota bacterium]|nr:flavin reductase family protein [Actinomycetota bacterium]